MRAAQSKMSLDDDEVMNLLIDTTIASKSETNSKALVEFLLGEKDGYPKVMWFIYGDLWMYLFSTLSINECSFLLTRRFCTLL